MNPRLRALRAEFDKCRSAIDAIESAPAGDGGDLSDQQQTDADTLYARCEELTPEIEKLADRERSLASTADVLARLGASVPARREPAEQKFEAPTAGEWLARSFSALSGDTDAQRWIEDCARALDVQTTADAGAVLPKPIVGDLLSIVDASRPVFSSLTPQPMPGEGKTFVRPRITTHVEVGEQLTEGAELASNKMVLTGDDVIKRTVAGALQLSRQDLDWTSPAALQLVVNDFVDMYGTWTEGAACTALTGAVTTNTSPWVGTDVGTIISSITAGVQAVYTSSKRMPTTMWLSLDEALTLAAVTNTDDSVTAIEMIKRALQFVGINLDFVVGPQLAADTRILGSKLRTESYEQQFGLLQAELVGNLKREIAYGGYIAFHIRPESVVGLVV